MTLPTRPTDNELGEYIDGGLDQQRRNEIAAWLRAHPDHAAEVERLAHLNEALSSLGAGILEEPVPDRLRQVLRRAKARGDAGGPRSSGGGGQEAGPDRPSSAGESEAVGRRRPRFSSSRVWPTFIEAAIILLVFVVGGVTGWSLRVYLDQAPSAVHRILTDARHAYSFYASDPNHPIEFPPEEADAFAEVAARLFQRALAPPDLQPIGYQYLGARLVPTARTTASLFFFEGEDGERIMVLSWPLEAAGRDSGDLSRDGVATRFWMFDGFGFAVLGDEVSSQLSQISNAVEMFYRDALRAG